MKNTSVEIPTLVRMKAGSLDRLGIYCRRVHFQRVVLLISSGLPGTISERARAALVGQEVEIMRWCEVDITAVFDWKLAFHARGTLVNDFAALLSDATVFQLMANPRRDLAGIRLLATALMLNGVAMEIAGSSRPASGSEHLISHALDAISARPRLHGLQVGLATYLISQLQQHRTDSIAQLFDATGFWEEIRRDPFSIADWTAAFRAALDIKPGFYTILSERDYTDDLARILQTDPRLKGLFI